MPDPLDLSEFGFSTEDQPAAAPDVSSAAAADQPPAQVNQALQPKPPLERLVDVSKLAPADLQAAQDSAGKIDFTESTTLIAHGEHAMREIAEASRQLLTNTRIGDSGEVGKIAAAVINGVKILGIEDLRRELVEKKPTGRSGLFGRMASSIADFVGDAHSAYKGFAENRKKFLTMMDEQEAKARAKKADLMVEVRLMDAQRDAIRKSLHDLMIKIAAGQIALDRAETEYETLRRHAIATDDPADAATVMAFHGAMVNFRAKIGEMRENLTKSALLIPVIEQNKKAAETRIGQISNGIMMVLPHLMAVASQAVVQADIRHAAAEGEKLREADRQITMLAADGAHDAAVSAAKSLSGDPRDLEVLESVAKQAVATMAEVQQIESRTAENDRQREAHLVEIRRNLSAGMRGVIDAGLRDGSGA